MKIIIIRHCDKLPRHPGPCLSPKGQKRAIDFAFYFLKKFKSVDHIFAKQPAPYKMTNANHSYRELLTVAPLANLLAIKENKAVKVHETFYDCEYPALAKKLLNNSKYKKKTILICWDHHYIPQLAYKLGVRPTPHKLSKDNYDFVYVLDYKNKQLTDFKILDAQYPVEGEYTWADFKKVKP